MIRDSPLLSSLAAIRFDLRVRWPGVILVALLVLGTLLLKSRIRHNAAPTTAKGIPSVILVADPSEADDSDDGCAVMFRAVRQAAKRGVAVAEVAPNSNSDLRHRYHVLTVPALLALHFDTRAGGKACRNNRCVGQKKIAMLPARITARCAGAGPHARCSNGS